MTRDLLQLRYFAWLAACLLSLTGGLATTRADEALRDEATAALRRAVQFYHGQVAAHGGYVYRYSADLAKREGEGQTGPDTVWVQPPGTPTVGLAYVDAYERTGDPLLLEAARSAGRCLIQGQLRSGAWTDRIEFAPEARAKFAYRVDRPTKKRQFNMSTFDDDKSQAALRMLMRLDQVLQFQDAELHAAVQFALDSVLAAQFANGAWAQGFDGPASPQPVQPASYPADWPRTYPGGDYWLQYTFNDNAIADTIEMLLLAARIYGEDKYRAAALRAGEFILLAQMPDPQPAWAQQYNFELQPAWARKFEPPAISGGESQGLLQVLLRLYEETGDDKFLTPVPQALDYLERSVLPTGQLARFYELRTNQPLYFTRDYQLTYDDGDLPTHYGFKVGHKLPQLRREWQELAGLSSEELAARRARRDQRSSSPPSDKSVRAILAALDERGAWVEEGRLQYHGKGDDTTRVISSATFARNIEALSRYVAQPAAGR